MKKLLTVFLCLAFILGSTVLGFAQEEEDEGPGQRYVTVTIFDMPLQIRDKVIPYMQKYVVPYFKLNPNIVTFRVLVHNWGSNASEMVYYSEYEEFEDINADCGQPCEDYEKEHPEPEEGDEGYEEFIEARDLYTKYFSGHHDEIYSVPMEAGKTEGEIIGTVGPPEEN